MATTDTARETVLAFIEGRRQVGRKLKSLVRDEDTVYSYGYHWPLVRRVGERSDPDVNYQLCINDCSATTNRHRKAADEALQAAGFADTGMRVTHTIRHYRGFGHAAERTFAVYMKVPDNQRGNPDFAAWARRAADEHIALGGHQSRRWQ